MPLDIGVGILLSLGVHEYFGVALSTLLLCIGIGAALLPDIDIVTMAFGTWRHREYTHYPLLYIPACAMLFVFVPFPYALLIALGVYAHLVHDTFGIGWGIAWLWPFSGRKLLIFPENARRQVLGPLVSWTPEEEPAMRARQYPGGSANWVHDFYFRPNVLGVIEYGVLILALILLALAA